METSEEKLDRLRKERELEILKKKYKDEEFYLDEKGEIEYIKTENGFPKIGVVCGKNKVKFEKKWGEVFEDKRIEDFIAWENLEVPERLKKMDTVRLLTEFRKRKRYLRNTDEELVFKKELYLREHIGQTNAPMQKKIRQNKAKTKNDKRH